MPTTPGSFIPRFAFWNPSTWAIPELYWDTFSQEQRIHAICKQLGKVVAYADMLGVNVDDISSRLKAIEDGQLNDVIVDAVEQWFEENAPQLLSDVEDLQAALPISEFDAENTVKNVIDDFKAVIPASSFDAVNTVEKAINDIANDLDSFKDVIPASSFDAANTVEKAIDDLGDLLPATSFDSVNTVEAAINTVSDLLPATSFDSVNTVEAAIQKLQRQSSASLQMNRCFIDNVNGDDDTAIMGDETHPFKTLQAAEETASEYGGQYYFVFQNIGNYTMNNRVFVGTVFHFMVLDVTLVGAINIFIDAENTGGVYFYDSHVNITGTENCPVNVRFDDRLFQVEGSTLHANNGSITCSYLNLVQGSSHFINFTLNCYVRSFFAFMRCQSKVKINNQSPVPALYLWQANLRVDGDQLEIVENTNPSVSTQPAVYIIDGNMTWNAATYTGTSLSYARFLEVRSATLRMGDAFLALLDAKCANNSTITSLSLRVPTTINPLS